MYFLYPETAHRSLEEIDDMYVHRSTRGPANVLTFLCSSFESADPYKPWEIVKIAQDLPLRHPIKTDIDPNAAYALRRRFGQKEGAEVSHVEDVEKGKEK